MPFSIGVPVSATFKRGAAQLLGGVVGGVLDGLRFVEHQAGPVDRRDASMSRNAVP